IGAAIRAEAEKVIGQPAQAVDLRQFRACVLVGIRTTPEGSAERAECDRLLALIDSQAVGK
ncbi:hypothetical protein G4229_14785, partial [Listeria seeligeri]|uniref:hypothetical protein n=1 Tax=Listeria seeligeri TaxID=1640 RepID=UPI001BD9D96B